MWAFWRWFKADKGRPTVALGANERRPVAVEPPESLAFRGSKAEAIRGIFITGAKCRGVPRLSLCS